MIRKIPLAWLQLTREKPRLAVAMAGIAFADILMFMQLGFREALFNGNVRMHAALDGEIVLINPKTNALLSMKSFSQRRLYQALVFPGVKSVHPIYLAFSDWRNPTACDKSPKPVTNPDVVPLPCRPRTIQVMGVNPAENVFTLPGVQESLVKTKMPDVVLFDSGSRAEFGNVAADFKSGKTVSTEVGGRRVKVGGVFDMGASFGADGNLITSDLNFLRILKDKNRQYGLIDIGLIKLKPGTNPARIVKQMRDFYCQQKTTTFAKEDDNYQCQDVKVFTKQEFVDFEKDYWASSTPIGFIFTLGTAIGFIVGTVIVYQILYTEVADHLPEYATLKAMGYTQTYLFMVVFQEALILAFIGYFPGFAFALFQYHMARSATLLPLFMTVSRAITVLILTILMCTISGGIAVRKLQAADPADIF